MSRETRLVARLLTTISVLSLTAVPGHAQSGRLPGSNQVLSSRDNQSAGTLVIETEKKIPLPAPQIQFLPGANGATVLIADFDGLVWSLPTHVSRWQNYGVSRFKGIQEVRAGQFQAMPPVSRISISSTDPSIFRSVSFKASPGKLVVTWPAHRGATATDATGGGINETEPLAAASNMSSEEEFSLARSLKKKVKTISNYLSSDPPSEPAAAPQPGAGARRAANPPPHPFAAQPAQAPPSKAATFAPSKQAPPAAPAAQAPTAQSTAAKSQPKSVPQPAPDYMARKSPDEPAPGKPIAAPYEAAPPNAVARFLGISRWKNILQGEDDSRSGRVDKKAGDERRGEARSGKAGSLSDDRITYEARSDESGASAGTTSDTNGNADQNVPKLEIAAGTAAARIRLMSETPLKFKSFRLHEPERYVIDFEQLAGLASAQMPEMQDRTLVQSVRVGSPDGSSGRLVLDLSSQQVNVSESNVNSKELTLVLTTGDTPAQQLVRKRDAIKNVTIVLDAGHGGSDPGAQRAGVSEKEITLAIASKLKKALEQAGANVQMTRTDDTFVSLEDRVKLTNSTSPDLFLSVHINALESTSDIHGIETYYQTDQSKPLAECIHKMLVDLLEAPDRSVRKARFYVINHTPVPAILAEVGFISNNEEREKLISSDYQNKVADALTQGVILYLSRKDDIAQTPAGTAKGATGEPVQRADARPVQRLAETTSAGARPLK